MLEIINNAWYYKSQTKVLITVLIMNSNEYSMSNIINIIITYNKLLFITFNLVT